MNAATSRAWRPLWPEVEGLIRQRQPGGKLPRANGAGWIGPIRSPLRDDANPSFSVKPDSETTPAPSKTTPPEAEAAWRTWRGCSGMRWAATVRARNPRVTPRRRRP